MGSLLVLDVKVLPFLQKETDLISDILDNGFIFDLTCFEIRSHGLVTLKMLGTLKKIFSFAYAKTSKSFGKALNKWPF